jgi:hypothetical protein
VSWAKLLADNRVTALRPNKAELDDLRSIVARSLKDVTAPGLSADARFTMAYDAARTLSLLVVRASGYRPRSAGAHYNTFLALEASDPAFAQLSAYFDSCRIKRNICEYDLAGGVSDTEAEALLNRWALRGRCGGLDLRALSAPRLRFHHSTRAYMASCRDSPSSLSLSRTDCTGISVAEGHLVLQLDNTADRRAHGKAGIVRKDGAEGAWQLCYTTIIRRRFRSLLASLPLILVVAVGIRLLSARDYAGHRPHQALSVIPFLFESGNIAHSLAIGKGFASPFRIDTGPTAWTTPVYPLLLGGLMRLFGPYTYASYEAAAAVNILFSSLVCVPLYFAGKRIGGAGLGALAAWLWAIFPNAILLTYESLWEACLSALLGAALLWATLRVAESGRARAWCGYGLLFGLALMTNAALLSLLPLLGGWALYRCRQHGGPWLRNAILTAGLAAACCVPWTIRNYTVFHSFIPLRSILGLQLWVGNNPQAKVVWLGEQHPIHDQAEREKYIDMGEVAYMRQKERDAVAYIATHPGREAALVAGRFVSLWSGGTPTPLHDFRTNPSIWFRYVLLLNGAAGLGALLGIFFLIRERSPYAFPAAVYPLVYPWAYYLTLALPRYRHPIDPIVLLLTAVSLQRAARTRKLPAKGTPVPAVHGIDPPIIRTYNK